nr:hypothetical protein [Xanthomonas populi]
MLTNYAPAHSAAKRAPFFPRRFPVAAVVNDQRRTIKFRKALRCIDIGEALPAPLMQPIFERCERARRDTEPTELALRTLRRRLACRAGASFRLARRAVV